VFGIVEAIDAQSDAAALTALTLLNESAGATSATTTQMDIA
jgi:hypothetical protein